VDVILSAFHLVRMEEDALSQICVNAQMELMEKDANLMVKEVTPLVLFAVLCSSFWQCLSKLSTKIWIICMNYVFFLQNDCQ